MHVQGDEAARLSRIDTLWTVLRQAHGESDKAGEAQKLMLQRYSGAIYRYLLAVLRDSNAADEVFQEFALAFLQGQFRKADPGKGRFRDYVKTGLFHLVSKYRKRQHREPVHADSVVLTQTPAASEPAVDEESAFTHSWRDELLARTWQRLAELEKRTGSPFHSALCWRTQHPEQESAVMAEQFGRHLGKPLTAESVRQMIHRARAKFADLLVEEVRHSLHDTDPNALEQELADLGLLAYCGDALKRQANDRQEACGRAMSSAD